MAMDRTLAAIRETNERDRRHATEDDERRAQDEVQRMTDNTIAQIDKLVQAKLSKG